MRAKVCGRVCQIYSRVVGYYRAVSAWNPGKQTEFMEREVFTLEDSANSSGDNTKPKD